MVELFFIKKIKKSEIKINRIGRKKVKSNEIRKNQIEKIKTRNSKLEENNSEVKRIWIEN